MGQSDSKQSKTTQDVSSRSNNVVKIPIVYHPKYNLSMMGLDKFSKFDMLKSEKIRNMLVKNGVGDENSFEVPCMPSDEELKKVHTADYLDSLKMKSTVASITNMPILKIFSKSFIANSILNPMCLQAGGSVLAAELALHNGWAINLGGGQHHCSHDQATPGGFSAYADITMIVKSVQKSGKGINRILIIDLDANQGNGYSRDFIHDSSVFIFDIYNPDVFPQDEQAKSFIQRKIEIKSGAGDEEYLNHLRENMDSVLDEFDPQYVVYNAGVDILKGDPIGMLDVSPDGVIERDYIVFKAVRSREIPIVMLLSGGFLKIAAKIVADSIIRLHNENLITIPSQSLSN